MVITLACHASNEGSIPSDCAIQLIFFISSDFQVSWYVGVAQLVEAVVSKAIQCGFKSRSLYAPVDQLVESKVLKTLKYWFESSSEHIGS